MCRRREGDAWNIKGNIYSYSKVWLERFLLQLNQATKGTPIQRLLVYVIDWRQEQRGLGDSSLLFLANYLCMKYKICSCVGSFILSTFLWPDFIMQSFSSKQRLHLSASLMQAVALFRMAHFTDVEDPVFVINSHIRF